MSNLNGDGAFLVRIGTGDMMALSLKYTDVETATYQVHHSHIHRKEK